TAYMFLDCCSCCLPDTSRPLDGLTILSSFVLMGGPHHALNPRQHGKGTNEANHLKLHEAVTKSSWEREDLASLCGVGAILLLTQEAAVIPVALLNALTEGGKTLQ